MGFQVFTGDVKAAFLHGHEGEVDRNVLLEPVAELKKALRLFLKEPSPLSTSGSPDLHRQPHAREKNAGIRQSISPMNISALCRNEQMERQQQMV